MFHAAFQVIRNWWWAQQRAADLRLLWPQCKIVAPTLNKAREAFMVHAMRCPCWARHYGGRLADEITKLK